MWNCPSKLKLDGDAVFTRADGNVRAFCFPDVALTVALGSFTVERQACGSLVSRVEPSALRLFQLALGFFGKGQMLLNHFCCIIRKLLQVGIAPIACFLFEFGQVFFVVLHHHVHVGLI
jgi:hypothetical protein